MIYFFTRLFLYIYFKLFYNLKVEGKEHIPQGRFIIASNHTSHLDPPVLGAALPLPIWFLAKKELFQHPFMNWFLRKLHSIPIDRGSFDLKAIRQIFKHLSEDKPLVVFPEGTRSVDGQLKAAEKGIGFIAHKAKTPIVPIYISGTFEALPKCAKGLKKSSIRVKIGGSICLDHNGDKVNDDYYIEIGAKIMSAIKSLKG